MGIPIGGERKAARHGSPGQQSMDKPEEFHEARAGEDDEMEDEGDVTQMFKSMMKMMKSVKTEVSSMRKDVGDAQNTASQA